MAKQLTEVQITEIREIFTLFDKDSDGQVATTELGTMIRALGFNPTENEIMEQMAIIDKNQTGMFDQTSFISLVARLDIKDSLEELTEALKVLSQGNDKMPVMDFKYSMTHSGEEMHEYEVDEILKDLDAVYNSDIYIEEFAKLIYNK